MPSWSKLNLYVRVCFESLLVLKLVNLKQ